MSPVWITAEFGKRSDQITEGDFLMARKKKKNMFVAREGQ